MAETKTQTGTRTGAVAAFRQPYLEHGGREITFFVLLGLALACVALLGDSWAAGWREIGEVLFSPDWEWFGVAVAGEILAYMGYTLAYREIVRVEGGPVLGLGHSAALVASGFGVFIPRGGFAADLEALGERCEDERDARIRVLGLGALEFAVLAPAACACALYLIFRGWKVQTGMTLPWAIAVPVGFLLAVWAIRHRTRFANRRGWRAAARPRAPRRQRRAPARREPARPRRARLPRHGPVLAAATSSCSGPACASSSATTRPSRP